MLCTVYHWLGAAWQDSAWSEGRCMQEPSASAACLPAQQARPHSPAVQNVNGLHSVGPLGSRHSEVLAEHCWTGSCSWVTIFACSCWLLLLLLLNCLLCRCRWPCEFLASDVQMPMSQTMQGIIPHDSVSDLPELLLNAKRVMPLLTLCLSIYLHVVDRCSVRIWFWSKANRTA